MYLRDLSRSLGRRWYFVVVGLIAVAGLCVFVLRLVPPTYEARANVMLLPSEQSTQESGNPFLMLSGLTQPLDVLIRTMDATTTRTAILGDVPGLDYIIEPDPMSNSPILTVLATGPSADQALGVLGAVLDRVTTTLDGLQAELDVPASARVATMALTVDTEAVADNKNQLRALVAAAAVGVAGVALLTGLLDSVLLTRRQRRREASTPDARPEDAVPAGDARADDASEVAAPAVAARPPAGGTRSSLMEAGTH